MTAGAVAAPPGSRGRRIRARALPYGLSLPTFIIVAFFIIGPLVSVILTTFDKSPAFPTAPQGNYVRVLGEPFYQGVLLNTVTSGLLATVITLILGYPLALYIAFSSDRARRFVMLCVLSPLFISIVVRAYALSLGLGPGNPIDRLFPGLSFNLLFTRQAVILGLVYTMLPYMIISLSVALTAVDRRTLSASESLGVSFFYTLRRVLLPLSLPGIAAGSVLVLTMSITSLIVPLTLGGIKFQLWAWEIYEQILVVADWPTGFTMGIILTVVIVVLIGLTQLFLRRSERRIR